ncbi:FKBP-type peptidyl-prolyl cis-trans isomerase [Chloroflexia bacterium SDU3-3]|nr:FKBP-type peptidyl-prolyl cis-trans isomerase [Chloroflexia bacterium SDU3-3]
MSAGKLEYIEIEAGSGAQPKAGDVVSVHYTGTLPNGTVFDSSYSRNEPIAFVLGRGQVIAGWDQGIAMMRVGGKAQLVIPPELGYGARGAGGVIPPNATLHFDVELMGVQAGPPEAPQKVASYVSERGLQYADLEVGTGPEARKGQQATVHYTGWLTSGQMFDSSLNRGQPFTFGLGAGQVIKGWDEGVAGMKVGGKRQLLLPPEMGYGARGAGGVIPPNATLVFEVELLDVK